MPPEFTENQIDDIREIHALCEELRTDFVIIGAIAYQLYFPDENRFTADIDTAIALDLNEFLELERRLKASDWTPVPNREHRWRSRRGSYFDLVPAGPKLRQAKQILWPKSQFAMSLVGFDHVFTKAESHPIARDLTVKAIPPVVLALTKIVSYVGDPYGRVKDLNDIRSLLKRYEEGSDRIFDAVVFEAKLPDIEFANAFLLGLDLAELCLPEERDIVDQFVKRLGDEEDNLASLVAALKKGFLHKG